LSAGLGCGGLGRPCADFQIGREQRELDRPRQLLGLSALPGHPQQRRANHIRVAGQRVAPALQRQGLAAGLLQQILQRPALGGISLLELLVTIAIIVVLAALIVPNVSPMRGAASSQIARQQQAQLQTALGAWIAAASSGPGGLTAARSAYAATNNKLGLLADYLQPATVANLSNSGSVITSAALSAAGARLEFSGWSGTTDAPIVEWKPQ